MEKQACTKVLSFRNGEPCRDDLVPIPEKGEDAEEESGGEAGALSVGLDCILHTKVGLCINAGLSVWVHLT